MSKPKQNKSGSKAGKRIPGRKKETINCCGCRIELVNVHERAKKYCRKCQRKSRIAEIFNQRKERTNEG